MFVSESSLSVRNMNENRCRVFIHSFLSNEFVVTKVYPVMFAWFSKKRQTQTQLMNIRVVESRCFLILSDESTRRKRSSSRCEWIEANQNIWTCFQSNEPSNRWISWLLKTNSGTIDWIIPWNMVVVFTDKRNLQLNILPFDQLNWSKWMAQMNVSTKWAAYLLCVQKWTT